MNPLPEYDIALHNENSHSAVRNLLSQPVSPESLQQFTRAHAFPLVAPGWVTFVWIGEARAVTLLRWIHGGVDRTDFQRVPESPLWLLHLPVKDGGRFEYKLSIEHDNGHEWVLDPLNKARAGDPYGENSVCRTYGYAQPDWSKPQEAPSGRIEAFPVHSAVFEEVRNEQVYLPAKYDSDTSYPLLVIHDGADFMTYADLGTCLDNLIDTGTIPPIIAALVQTPDRMGEYARGHRHARYLVSDLLPQLEHTYPLSARSEDRIVVGASLGAVASLATVFRYPGVFGGAILQSGSFILDENKLEGREHPVFRRVERMVKAVKRTPSMPELRAFVSTGELEGLASESKALAVFLQENGVSVLFKRAWDGHHWHNWRDQLRDGLVWVLKR